MGKSEQSENKVILDLDAIKHENTKLRIQSLEEVELKYISVFDMETFMGILGKENIRDKDFVQEVLYNQLVKPKIGLSGFKQISEDDLLRIAKAFVTNEDDTFQHFQDSGAFYKDFRIAIKSYLEKQLEHMKKSHERMIVSSQEALRGFCNNYASAIKLPLYASSYIKDSLQLITEVVAKQLRKTQVGLAELSEQIIEQYQASVRSLLESVQLQIDVWQKWAEKNRKLFDSFRQLIDSKQRQFLFKNGWIFTHYLKGKSIENKLLNKGLFRKSNSEINKIYEDFFSKDNYKELELMIKSWRKNQFFEPRIRIFLSCLTALRTYRRNKRNVRGVNPATILLPALVAQIDGIGLLYARNKGLLLNITKLKDPITGEIFANWIEWMWGLGSGDSLEVFSFYMLQEFLFAKAYPVGQEKGQHKAKESPKNVRFFLQYNRNKILHGEDIKYGTIDNLLRTFLVLDFLGHLK